ncbi:MAG: hypothetical protein WCI92_18355 [Bacteroidota bacterium]
MALFAKYQTVNPLFSFVKLTTEHQTHPSNSIPHPMPGKKSFLIKYSIIVHQQEYTREYTVKGAKNKEAAEKKLHALCSSEIIITSNTEIL